MSLRMYIIYRGISSFIVVVFVVAVVVIMIITAVIAMQDENNCEMRHLSYKIH